MRDDVDAKIQETVLEEWKFLVPGLCHRSPHMINCLLDTVMGCRQFDPGVFSRALVETTASLLDMERTFMEIDSYRVGGTHGVVGRNSR